MTRKSFITILPAAMLIAISLMACTGTGSDTGAVTQYTAYVDPHIGSGGHGHVFVGASVPFGMVQLGPTNPTEGWDWCSGYHYSDSLLTGFTHTHLSGTGIGDLCDILVMPVSSAYVPTDTGKVYQDWAELYTHGDEVVKPGFYSLNLKTIGVQARLTASTRVGFHHYNYQNEGNSTVLVDMISGKGWDRFSEGSIRQVNDYTISGYRFSKGWADDQRLFFTTEFSKKIKEIRYIKNEQQKQRFGKENNTALIVFEGNGELMVKTALSPVSEEGAAENLVQEIPHWDFDRVYAQADELWNRELGKISIKTKSDAVRRTFYTALYHTMIAPSTYNDHSGTYRGADKKIYASEGFINYTTLSLWDTYRAAHPLYTIFQPERVSDMVNTMLAIHRQQGKLPVWHLMACETNCMVGYHAVPVVVDAYMKGFTGFDAQVAYNAIKETAMLNERGVNFIKEKGFIPADKSVESVAMALEYAIDDWCIAQMAYRLGKEEDFRYFMNRSKAYKHYYDAETRFFRGKLSDESFRTPFDPISSKHRDDDYCEGNAWQYLWLVPHDVEGLIELFGSETAFVQKLDSLFVIDSDLGEGASADITGLIGQYAHGNEPSHHITYLYAFAGEQWKTADKVRHILNHLYFDQPDGLSGNEDCGQMSAWYILSSMGFYPVNPAAGIYVFGSPLLDEVTLKLPGNKLMRIVAKNNSDKNIYIQSVTLNGKPHTQSFITHTDLVNGGELVFNMGPKPNKDFGKAIADRPQSKVY
jgi:predicted alpha-1,2-mannosidase